MKKARIISISLVMLLILASCSKKNNNLEVFSTKSENIEVIKTLIEKFEEEYKIDVTFSAPADAGTVLKTRLTKDDLPDVMIMNGDTKYKELSNNDALHDFSQDKIAEQALDNYKDVLIKLNDDRKLFGVPYASNMLGIIYNRGIFESEGLAVPKNWDSFVSTIEHLKEKNITTYELTFKDAWTLNPIWNALLANLQEESHYEDNQNGKSNFQNDLIYTETLEKMSYIMDEAENDYMGTGYSDGNMNFSKGDVAMMMNGNWAVPEIRATNADLDIGIFPFPASDNENNYFVSGVDVLLTLKKETKFEEEGMKFIEFMMRPENAQVYTADQFTFSALKGIEQNDQGLNLAQDAISQNKTKLFPDLFYPPGFDDAAILSEFSLNKINGMDLKENIEQTLNKLDASFEHMSGGS